MKQLGLFFLAGVAAFSLSSCSKDSADKAKPLIEVLAPLSPNGEIEAYAGQPLPISIKFVDNVDLKEYKLDIHDDFDGHTHGRVSYEPWSYLEIDALAGNLKTLTKDIQIPTTAAAGKYHLIINCVDKAGNQAEFVEIDLLIKNPDDEQNPTVTVFPPNNVSTININLGQTLTFAGVANDNKRLRKMEVHMHYEPTDAEIFHTDTTFVDSVSNFPFSYAIPVTNSMPTGDYNIEVKLEDAVYNRLTKNIRVKVNP